MERFNLMHWCADETFMLLMMLPFIGMYFAKLHAWYHTKFGHKCHDKECNETHVLHLELEELEQDPEIPITLTEEDVTDPFAGWRLTHKGFVAGFIFCNGPISEEDLLKRFSAEDTWRLKEAIQVALSDATIKMKDDKLIFGEL